MGRMLKFQKVFWTLLLIGLVGFPTDSFAHEAPKPRPVWKHFLSRNPDFLKNIEKVVGEFPGQIGPKGHRIYFKKLPSRLVKASDLRSILKLRFKHRLPFSAKHIRFNLNGILPRYGRYFGLSPLSQWVKGKDGTWVLYVDVSKLVFPGNHSFGVFLRRIQEHNGEVDLFFGSPSKVVAASLLFVRGEEPQHKPPFVVMDRVEPTGKVIASRSILFAFHASEEDALYKCSLDHARYDACSSPVSFNGLQNGVHSFSVVARTDEGHDGPALEYEFKVEVTTLEKVTLQAIAPQAPITKSTSLQVSFSISGSNQAALCRMDDGAAFTCLSPYTFSGVGEGSHSISIAPQAGGTAANYTWIVDQTAPQITWSQTPSELTSETTATFAFAANEQAGFKCALDGGVLSDCSSPMSFNSLADGAHSFRTVATDIAGNVSTPLTALWLVDTIAPVVNLLGAIPQQPVVNAQTLSLSFAATEYSTFKCNLDQGNWTACTSPFASSALTEGTHSIAILATDLAGNVSEAAHYNWTIDLTPSVLTLNMTFPYSLPTNQTAADFEITSTETDVFECKLNGTPISQCGFPLHLTNLAERNNRLEVSATDVAGNLSETVEFTWAVDVTPPVVSITSAVPAEKVTQLNQIQLFIQTTENAPAMCELDQGGSLSCAGSISYSDLVDGDHTISLSATDLAGNVSQPLLYSWRVQSIVAANIVSVAPAGTLTASRNIAFVLSSINAAGLMCALDGAAFTSCQSPASYAGLPDGNHHFEIRALDGQGTMRDGAVYDWSVDATAPNLTLTTISPVGSPTSQRTISIGFTASEAVTFFCTLNSGVAGNCASPYQASNLQEGSHTLSVIGIDATGNQSAPLSYQWTIDTTAPVTTIQATSPSYSPTSMTTQTLLIYTNETATSLCSLDNAIAATCTSPLTVSGLTDGAHSLAVYSVDFAGNTGATVAYNWTVNTTPIVTSNVSTSQITRTTAIITWTTNIATTSRVLYGVGSLNSSTAIDPVYTTTHSVTLTGLTPFAFYSFQTESVDSDGRGSNSATFNFRTLR